MKLEEIYEVLKKSTSSNFYVSNKIEDFTFVYLKDEQLSISKIREKKQFGYNHFFDDNDKQKKLADKYEELIRDLCELKNYPETYDSIRLEDWKVIYNGKVVHKISFINIYNPSSLDISLPSILNPFDYVMNFCKIYNSYINANSTPYGEDIIQQKINVKKSTFDDFVSLP